MAELWKGAAVNAVLNERLRSEVETLRSCGVTPQLAIVRMGERPDDIAYERGAIKRCESIGVKVCCHTLPADADEAALLAVIDRVNRDVEIHGCLLLRPLPPQIDDTRVRNALLPEKDVDGITDQSLAGVFTGGGVGFPPCTAEACLTIFDHFGYALQGRRAVVIGRSLVVGKPVAMLLLARHATVTVCHTRTQDMPAITREADLLIVAAGKPRIIDAPYFGQGQVVIDVGIHVDETGALCGDVDFAAAEPLVKAITPVPGGVGTVTTSVLVQHVIEAARRQQPSGK